MRVHLNLASRPFVELRPVFMRLRILALILLLTSAGLGFMLHRATERARAEQAELNDLLSRTDATHREYAGYQRAMRQPQNAEVLSRAQFLNALFTRKAFSWTAVMMDLENVLPAGVQVVNIEPALTPEGHVTMKLRVTGPREKTVDLVRNLERSKRFTAARLVGEAAESQTPGQFVQQVSATAPTDVAFDIVADYVPLESVGVTPERSSDQVPSAQPRHHAPSSKKRRQP
jgi:type IV pilus assembly protein PilN